MKNLCASVLALFVSVFFIPSHSQTVQPLFSFSCDPVTNLCTDGSAPNSLIQGSDGNYYGTTLFSGTVKGAFGTVFKLSRGAQFTLLYSFAADQDGKYSNGGGPVSLVEGNDGFLYGAAQSGGANNAGVIFKLSKSGTIQIVHNFCSLPNCADGSNPGPLILASDGNFYGGVSGNSSTAGTVFRLTPAGTFTVLHTFDPTAEGATLLGLVEASDGNLYGTTVGAQTLLTCIFRLTMSGQFTLLHPFHYGQFTVSAPFQASNGKLYGTLSRFESNAEAGLFEMNLSGTGFQQFALPGPFDESIRPLTEASDGNLWATMPGGGSSSDGALIKLSLSGNPLQTVSFQGANGSVPNSPAFQSSNGEIVGTTSSGGSVGNDKTPSGVVFNLDAGLAAPKPVLAVLNPSSGGVGAKVIIYGDHVVGTTQVRFNGVTASYKVLNAHTILATVPSGATTGPIAATNAGGVTVSTRIFTIK